MNADRSHALRSNAVLTLGLAVSLSACDRPTAPSSTAPSAQRSAPSNVTGTPATLAAVSPSAPPSSAGSLAATQPSSSNVVTFDSEPAGTPSPSFEAVVGEWYVAEEAGAHGLKVDGGKWRNGTPSANLADQARRLYGDRYAEFLDGVKVFAFFPLAVWKNDPPAGDLTISVRFYPYAGSIDQAAGIAFGIAPDGSYFGIRANALEDNILYFRVVKGKRTVIDNIRNTPTPSKSWHTLSVDIRGSKITATLDGQKRFEKALESASAGKLGLWSKADSQVLFDDFKVEALAR